MHRQYILPVLLFLFCLTSIVGLRSIAPELATQQLIFFILGGIIFFITSSLPFWWLQKLSYYFFGGLIFTLVLTLIFADPTRGSTRWITIAGVNLQFSQLAIPIGALAAAHFATKTKQTVKGFLTLIGFIMLPAVPIFVQPDLGTTIVYLLSVGVIVFLSTQTYRYIISTVAVGFVVVIIAWIFLLQPYQKARIFGFVGSQADSDVTYNARQALIAVGSGQLYGRGLGQGIQSHLRFLPERQTDFIFASLAEELGFAGAIFIVGLYVAQVSIILFIAEQAQKPEQVWFCYSIASMLTLQAGVNIGMNIGLVPITGVTLPLLSYGGSSVLSLCFAYGLVQSLTYQQKKNIVLSIT